MGATRNGIEVYDDNSNTGTWRFRIRRNGRIVNDNYTRKSDALRAARALAKFINGTKQITVFVAVRDKKR